MFNEWKLCETPDIHLLVPPLVATLLRCETEIDDPVFLLIMRGLLLNRSKDIAAAADAYQELQIHILSRYLVSDSMNRCLNKFLK